MKISSLHIIIALSFFLFSCKNDQGSSSQAEAKENPHAHMNNDDANVGENSLLYPEEKHLKNIRQLSFGGDNAEAYWSFDDKQLVFQSNFKDWGVGCDQMFLMNATDTFESSIPPMISTGKGRTTCAYFLPDNKNIYKGECLYVCA